MRCRCCTCPRLATLTCWLCPALLTRCLCPLLTSRPRLSLVSRPGVCAWSSDRVGSAEHENLSSHGARPVHYIISMMLSSDTLPVPDASDPLPVPPLDVSAPSESGKSSWDACVVVRQGCRCGAGKIDVWLPGKRSSKSHDARPVHPIVSTKKWIRTSRLSMKNERQGWRWGAWETCPGT